MTHDDRRETTSLNLLRQRTVARRSFMLGGAAAAGVGMLAGCRTDGGSTATGGGPSGSVLPNQVESTGVTPDLPPDDNGVLAGYFAFPREPTRSVDEVPGDGSEITGFARITYSAPPGPSSNSWWAGLNERLGVDLKMEMIPSQDYRQKVATILAGGAIPDVVQIEPDSIPSTPGVLRSLFQPLEDFLAGDAIAEYPNLAALDTRTWQSTVFDGSLFGIPMPRGTIENYVFARADLFAERDLPLDPQGWDAFVEVCEALTSPGQRRWALGQVGRSLAYAERMNGSPNDWAMRDDGTLVSKFETEEYRQAVIDTADLWNRGVIHPDGLSPTQPYKELFNAGTVAITPSDGYGAWRQYTAQNADNPDYELGLMSIYNRDGSALAPWHIGAGVYKAFAALRKQDDPERVHTILRVLNWLAAPFGTEEFLYRFYGEEGVDHTLTAEGDPVLTEQGTMNTRVPIKYLADSMPFLYEPGRPQDVELQHDYQATVLADPMPNAVENLYSPTQSAKGIAAERTLTDVCNQVIVGRSSLDEFDDAVESWRTDIGDTVRQEYLEALEERS